MRERGSLWTLESPHQAQAQSATTTREEEEEGRQPPEMTRASCTPQLCTAPILYTECRYLCRVYKDNHFYLRRLAELTLCFMETSPEIPILRAQQITMNNCYRYKIYITK